jgi:hypothetical protein
VPSSFYQFILKGCKYRKKENKSQPEIKNIWQSRLNAPQTAFLFLLFLSGTRVFIKTIGTMLAAALATVTSFKMILRGKNHKALFVKIIIAGF